MRQMASTGLPIGTWRRPMHDFKRLARAPWLPATVNPSVEVRHKKSRAMAFPGAWIMAALAALSLSCNHSSSPPAPSPQPSPTPRTFSLHGHAWAVKDVALSTNGHLALSADDGGFLRLWDVATGELLHVLVQSPNIESVSLSADGRVALSSNYEGMRIWDTSTGELLRKFGHDERENLMYSVRVALSANGRFVLSVGLDGTMRFWDAGTGELLRTFARDSRDLHQHPVSDVALGVDGRFALSGDEGGALLYWDTATGGVLYRFLHEADESGYSRMTTSLSADGQHALSGTSDGTMRLWDLRSGALLRTFDHLAHAPDILTSIERHNLAPDFHNRVIHVALNSDGSLATSIAADGFLRLWSSTSEAPLRTLRPKGLVNAMAFNAQGSIAMTGGYHSPYTDHLSEGTLHVWDMTRDDPAWQAGPTGATPNLRMNYTVTPSSTDEGRYAMEVSLKGFLGAQEGETVRYQWQLHGPNDNLIDRQEGEDWTVTLTEPGRNTIRLTATKDNGSPLTREETLYLPDTQRPTAAISGLPESGHGPRYLDLDALASSDEDGEIVRFHWQISYISSIDKQTSWSGVLSPGIHEISLTVIDDDGARDTLSKTIYLEPDPDFYDVTVYNDNVVIMDLGTLEERVFNSIFGPSPIVDYSWVVYTHFEDAFDYLLFFSNDDKVSKNDLELGLFLPLQDLEKGLGAHASGDRRALGSNERLQRIVHFPYWFALEDGPILHEIMHTWGNYMIPTSHFGHFGFSSANGQMGGFDAGQLQRKPEFDQEDGEAWVVPGSDWRSIMSGTPRSGPYSPIELYLAGWVPINEVPALRAAPNAYPLNTENIQGWPALYVLSDDALVLDADGNVVWIVPDWEEYTPERILERFGERIPPFGEARTEFRAAAILLTDEDHPATEERLKELSAQVAAFSRKGDDGADTTNFYEATGGRATITMDGLDALKKPVPTLPRFDGSDP